MREAVFVDVGGVRLRVSVRGRGRPLLLFNGIGASLELLDPLRRALPAVRDDRGRHAGQRRLGDHGHCRAALAAWRGWPRRSSTCSAYRQVDVLGVSWGGALAQEFALQQPARVRRLVLAATSTGWLGVPGRPSALWVLATPRRYYSPRYFEARRAHALRRRSARQPAPAAPAGPPALHPPAVAARLPVAARGGMRLDQHVSAALPPLPDAGARRRRRSDRPAGQRAADRLARAQRAAARRPGGGHLFLVTHAAEVAPLIERFLAEPDGERR